MSPHGTGFIAAISGGDVRAQRIIKKYPNRRLYDAGIGRYITVREIRKLVLDRVDFLVRDYVTGADVTRTVLLQVLSEQCRSRRGPSRQSLERLIRS